MSSSRSSLIQGLRDILGVLLLLGGGLFILYCLSQSMLPASNLPFVADFHDYWLAAGRAAQGGSPYNPTMLLGPLGSQGLDIYRYPPVLSFLLIPLSGLSFQDAGLIWLSITGLGIAIGLLTALWAGGAKFSPRAILWTGVAAVLFYPTLDSLMKGNVEGLQVLLIGLALIPNTRSRALSIAANGWLKISPALLVPALLIREGRRGLLWLMIGSAILVIPAFIWSPEGFWQFPRILINISGAATAVPANLAPSSWLELVTGSGALGAGVRAMMIISAIGLVALSVWLARQPEGWAAALLVGLSASLIMPGTIWEHYLLILLPFGVYAWAHLSFRAKTLLALAGAAISVGGLFNSPLAFLGASTFVLVILNSLWPEQSQRESSLKPTKGTESFILGSRSNAGGRDDVLA